jgi:hypothetical protein
MTNSAQGHLLGLTPLCRHNSPYRKYSRWWSGSGCSGCGLGHAQVFNRLPRRLRAIDAAAWALRTSLQTVRPHSSDAAMRQPPRSARS